MSCRTGQDKRGQAVCQLFARNRGQHNKLIKFLASFGLKVHNAQANTVCCLKLYPQDSHTHTGTHRHRGTRAHTNTELLPHRHRLPLDYCTLRVVVSVFYVGVLSVLCKAESALRTLSCLTEHCSRSCMASLLLLLSGTIRTTRRVQPESRIHGRAAEPRAEPNEM